MADCVFCKIISGQLSAETVYEDDAIIAFKDIHPKARVHILLVSKKHFPSLIEAAEQDLSLVSNLMRALPIIAKQQGLDQGFRTIINTGPGGGQEIDHLHFHLLGGGIPKF